MTTQQQIAPVYYELHRGTPLGVDVMLEQVDESSHPVWREGYSLSTCIAGHIEAASPEEVVVQWVMTWNDGDPPVELRLVPVHDTVWNATYRVKKMLSAHAFLTKRVHEAKLAADKAGYGQRDSFQYAHSAILTLMRNIGYSVTGREVWEALEAVNYPVS